MNDREVLEKMAEMWFSVAWGGGDTVKVDALGKLLEPYKKPDPTPLTQWLRHRKETASIRDAWNAGVYVMWKAAAARLNYGDVRMLNCEAKTLMEP